MRRDARSSRRPLDPKQEALRRHAIKVTILCAVLTLTFMVSGVLLLTTGSRGANETLDGVIAFCGVPFAVGGMYLGRSVLRRGARRGDYSPPH